MSVYKNCIKIFKALLFLYPAILFKAFLFCTYELSVLVNMIAEPDILLLDEPLTSLDVVLAVEMKQLLRANKDGRITIFSTHIMYLALDLCDVIVLLSHGELEVVDKENLGEEQFKEKIIAALKDEAYDVTPEVFDRRK